MSNLSRLTALACVAIVVAVASPRCQAATFATFDAAQFDANGFAFDDFNDFFAVDTSNGFIDIDIANDVAPGNGLFGGMGSDIVAEFDANTSQLEVALTVGADNAASSFNVVLVDNDGPTAGEEYQFSFDISGLAPGVPTVLTQSLVNPGPIFRQAAFGQDDGDAIQNYGLRQIQIQSVFDGTDRLNIEVDSIKLVDPNDPTLISYTAANFNAQVQSFTFGTFAEPGAFDTSGENIIINADSTVASGPNGGAGFNGLNIDFDAADYQIEVEAKLLAGNTAPEFNVMLGDNDGDDSGPMMGSEDYNFTVETSNFNDVDFSTFIIPLGSGSETSIVNTFGFTNGGDGLQNFDLSQMQIQAIEEAGGVLNLEIARFSIVERPEGAPGDFDNDGDVDGADFLVLQQGLGTTFDASDLLAWETAYGGAALAAAAAVPEPTSCVMLLYGMFLISARRSTRNA